MPDWEASLVLPHGLLTTSVSVATRTRTRSAIASPLRIHVSVDGIVGVTLRAVGFLGSRIYGAIPRSVLPGRHSSEMGRIAAAAMRTFITPCTFLWIMASVIQDHSLRDRALRQFVGHDVRLDGPAADIDGPVALSQGAVPWPARLRLSLVDECPEARYRITEGRATAAAFGVSVAAKPQVMGIAESQLFDVDVISAAAYSAHRLHHVRILQEVMG